LIDWIDDYLIVLDNFINLYLLYSKSDSHCMPGNSIFIIKSNFDQQIVVVLFGANKVIRSEIMVLRPPIKSSSQK
jgi:hypothetical protein